MSIADDENNIKGKMICLNKYCKQLYFYYTFSFYQFFSITNLAKKDCTYCTISYTTLLYSCSTSKQEDWSVDRTYIEENTEGKKSNRIVYKKQV